MKKTRKLIALTAAFILILIMIKPYMVSAATGVGENFNKSGVLQINVYHVDANTNNKVLIQSGSGFLISDSTEGSQYVITCNHVVDVSEEAKSYLREVLGIAQLNIKIEVVITRDLTQNVTITQASKEADYAILKLDAPIYQREAMILNPAGPSLTEDVYAMGYPDAIQDLSDFTYYSEDEVVVTKGNVSLCELMSDGVPYIQHSAVVTGGNSGGPLVDEDGYVVGLNTFVYSLDTGTYYYSLSIKEITNALDLIGINYQTPDNMSGSQEEPAGDTTTEAEGNSGETSEEPATEEPEVTIDTAALDGLLLDATGYLEEDYTEESFQNLQNAIDDANAVKNKADVTQAEIDSAKDTLQKAIDDLEKAGNNTMMLIVIIAVAVLIIIVIIIVIAVTSSKKKSSRRTGASSNPFAQDSMGLPSRTVTVPPSLVPQAPVPPKQPNMAGQPYMASRQMAATAGEGAGETSVLGYGAGETSVLGGANQGKATLTRIKTNETVDIVKQLFRVGKERNKVDFCITNNNSVSRIHADIVFKNGQYYIIDNNSTNYTFLNGQMVPAKQEVALSDGDRIKFAEEEFVFKLG